MLTRCRNPRAESFAAYGGRGIRVCERWAESFDAFLEDMGRRPSRKHTIDRIEKNGHYEPGNCRWATQREQQRNRRNNVYLELNGNRRLLCEWAETTGLTINIIWLRLRRGWSVERALTEPPRPIGPRRRLGDGLKRAIVDAYRAGGTMRDVATRFAVSPQTVCDLVGGRGRGRGTKRNNAVRAALLTPATPAPSTSPVTT